MLPLGKLKNMLKRITSKGNGASTQNAPLNIPLKTIIPRDQHPISRHSISSNAIKVLYRLQRAGFAAYLVGGSVRDLWLGREPKDFDIATNAKPEEVRRIFNNCRLIGRRFRLAHVYFHREIIEVATFRAKSEDSLDDQQQHSDEGMIVRDNVYGTIDDDIWRRDFTVNALYYNIADFSIVDYADGLRDLANGIIRIIGDPEQRFREDPVRILRAIRFAAKLSFTLDPATEAAITALAPSLNQVAKARLYDEVNKLFFYGYAAETFAMLRQYNLFALLFPLTEASLCDAQYHQVTDLLVLATLKNTDLRFQQQKPLTIAFLLAAMLWNPMQRCAEQYQKEGSHPRAAIEEAMDEMIRQQQTCFTLPRHCGQMVIDIWSLQDRLQHTDEKRAVKFLQNRRFRAAYDFLLMRTQAEPELNTIATFWTELQKAHGVYKP
jgi:poly(A) polymerase